MAFFIVENSFERAIPQRHVRINEGEGADYEDHCFWWGDQDIIHDPEATSPRILWIYINEEGPTMIYKMWDTPEGQAEETIRVTSDQDVLEALDWITPLAQK